MLLQRIGRSIILYKNAGQVRTCRHLTTDSRQAFLQPLNSHSGVTCLSLNRPQTKNAISLKLLQELGECLDNVQFDKR
jgi:methylglutaconyl-CoA hydratase